MDSSVESVEGGEEAVRLEVERERQEFVEQLKSQETVRHIIYSALR